MFSLLLLLSLPVVLVKNKLVFLKLHSIGYESDFMIQGRRLCVCTGCHLLKFNASRTCLVFDHTTEETYSRNIMCKLNF